MFYKQCKHLGFLRVCELIPVVAQGRLHWTSRLPHFSATRSLLSFPSDIFFFSHWDIIETNLRHLNIRSRVLLLSPFIHCIRCRCRAEPTCIYIHEEPCCSELSAQKTGQLIIPKSSCRAGGGSDSQHNPAARAGGMRAGRKALHPDLAPVRSLPFPLSLLSKNNIINSVLVISCTYRSRERTGTALVILGGRGFFPSDIVPEIGMWDAAEIQLVMQKNSGIFVLQFSVWELN